MNPPRISTGILADYLALATAPPPAAEAKPSMAQVRAEVREHGRAG